MSQPARWILSVFLLLIGLPAFAQSHQSGCHRWHSCPSDRGTYVCGDLGYCSQCPDNDYCLGGQPRQSRGVLPSPAPSVPVSPVMAPAVMPPSPAPPAPVQATFTGKVVGLSDGDTVDVLRDGKAVRVRLYGVDCPESKQAFGTRARQFSSALVFRQTVTVIVQDTDRYGRLVGEVRLSDGRSLNEELVQAGMAWWYRSYAPNNTTLAQLEVQARAEKRGLWADAAPVPPWEWRKKKR